MKKAPTPVRAGAAGSLIVCIGGVSRQSSVPDSPCL